MGLSWNIDNPMTFKVLQFNTNPHKRSMIVHRSVVVPRNISASGYNYALAPNSDAYLSEVRLYGETHIISDTPGQKGTVDPPDTIIAEGVRKVE